MAESVSEIRSLIEAQRGVAFMSLEATALWGAAGLYHVRRGKVRETIDLEDGSLLVVATDRISAFDYPQRNGIPGKGIILNEMAAQALERTQNLVPNHFITSNVDNYPVPFRRVDELRGRSMLVKKLDMLDTEAIARGYITGTGWNDYKRTGEVCGIVLPEGMLESQRIEPPIFTPSTKAKVGHDQNFSFGEMAMVLLRQHPELEELPELVKVTTLALYKEGAEYALKRGIILADTKFEFGMMEGPEGLMLVLGDEVLTPDSSRFWPADRYKPGGPQPSFDKQFVRDYARSRGWDKTPPTEPLPEEIVRGTQERYWEALTRLQP